MISVDNLSLQFGGRDIFNGISLLVNPRDKIGLVGRNGAGKTTLLRIFMKMQKPDSGEVVVPSDVTLGYLPQELVVKDTRTVFEEAVTAFEELNRLDDEINRLGQEISRRQDHESPEYLKLLEKYTEKHDRFSMLGGTNREAEIEQTLIGLGFRREDFDRPTREFSGGWRMRIELAKILLRSPDVFLLDEPTNHLDIESIQWLEEFLKNYSGAVLLISHDRAFLDRVTSRTVEISLGKVYDYKVPYSQFVALQHERREQQLAAFRNQQKMIGNTRDFIEKFRYKATKAVQVQSRIRQLGKIEPIEVEEEDTAAMNIKFPPAPRSGTMVIEARNLSAGYENRNVLENIDMVITRGEKVAFVGRNGEGKTTLSRVFANEIGCRGFFKPGHNVQMGYFAQNQDELLDGSKTVFETIDDIAVGDIRPKIRDILGAFLFSGEDVDKKVSVLSGGERSRLALAKLLLREYNLLILDEPSNHLDLRSKDILKQALLKFDGTLIVVSHDRAFLDGLVEKVYEFRNRKIKEYPGGIYDFLSYKKLHDLNELEKKDHIKITGNAGKESAGKTLWYEKKELDREIRRINSRIAKIEEKIEDIENRIKRKDYMIENPGQFREKINTKEFYTDYDKLKSELKKELDEWETLHTGLESLKSKRN